MISTAVASFTGAATGPQGHSLLRGGATLDYPVYSCPPRDDHLGDGEKILNIATARPGTAWGGFYFAHVPILPGNFPPLAWPPMAPRRHFCARGQQGGTRPKKQDRRKGHLRARHGVLCPCGYPYIPAPSNGPQKPPEASAGHKSTPARSVMEKAGVLSFIPGDG